MTLLVGAGLFTTTLAHLRANDSSLQSQRIVFTRAFREPADRELLPPGYYQALVTALARHAGRRCGGAVGVLPDVLRAQGGRPDRLSLHAGGRRHAARRHGADGLRIARLLRSVPIPSPGGPRRLVGRRPGDTRRRADLGVPGSRGVPGRRRDRPAHPDRRTRSSRRRSHRRCRRCALCQAGRPAPLVVFRPIMQETARTQFPMAYVRATGDLATVRDGYTRVVQVARASVAAQVFHHFVRMGRRRAAAGTLHGGRWPHSRRRSRSFWPASACTGCSRIP